MINTQKKEKTVKDPVVESQKIIDNHKKAEFLSRELRPVIRNKAKLLHLKK